MATKKVTKKKGAREVLEDAQVGKLQDDPSDSDDFSSYDPAGDAYIPRIDPFPVLSVQKVLKNFPDGYTPRPQQVEAIEKTVDAFNKGKRYVVLEMPTGTGKSFTAMAIARTVGSADLLTLTEQLQKQYEADFSKYGLKVLTGRGKHPCARMNRPMNMGGSCADGKHEYKGASACGAPGQPPCPYKTAKAKALEAPFMAANYHSYLWNVGASSMFSGDSEVPYARPLMVLDECHTLESFLLDQVGVTVSLNKIPIKLPPPPEERISPAPYFDYIGQVLLPGIVEAMREMVDPKERESAGQLARKLKHLLSKRDVEDWIPERGEDDGRLNPNWFSMKPLTVASYGRWIHGHAERLLLMSGTVLSAFQLVTSVGLDPREGDHIEMDSPFPVENRPVIVHKMDMTKKAREETWPAMMQVIENLLKHHSTQKGLLLVPSNEMLKYVIKNASRAAQLRFIPAYGDDRVEKYNEHLLRREPTVLIASGYWEGADLKGKSAEFCIIPAVPRAMWQGQIKARAGVSPDWYRWLNYSKMLQGMGRTVRSMDDKSVTYILDKEFAAEMKRKDTMVPKWVRNATRVIGE